MSFSIVNNFLDSHLVVFGDAWSSIVDIEVQFWHSKKSLLQTVALSLGSGHRTLTDRKQVCPEGCMNVSEN